jgi:hypothetical protein
MQLGAISLGFYYPDQYLEIKGVQLVNGISGFSWTATNGLFLMGWCDLNPLNINDDGVVVVLRIKTKNISGLTNGISLDIYENCEFANAMAVPNEFAVVSIPVINTNLTGIQHCISLNSLSVYPNPVSGNAVISFSIETPGIIQLSLVDIVGKNILNITNENYSIGNHKLVLQSAHLKPGIYFLKFTSTNNEKTISDMIKLVVSN